MSNVKNEHPKYILMRPKWTQIRDVLGGEERIKSVCRTTKKYLPLAETEPDAKRNRQRYAAYLERAVFYNATGRTLSGLVGQVFSKEPVLEFPTNVEYLKDDPAGSGVTLEQQAKGVLSEVMAFGRAGLWVDYPETSGGATRLEVESGVIRPIIKSYKAEEIINWRTRRVGAKTLLSLVVVTEEYLSEDDDFGARIYTRWREFRLNDAGEYCTRVWETGKQGYTTTAFVYPVDSNGERFREIPFVFIGIANNDSEIDEPPMYDMTCLNLGHFRNSADYEESCFMVGQPTPWFSGLTQDWVEKVMQGKVFLGSRGGVMLPAGGGAGLLQAQSNTIVKEAMDQKESQMIALGAKLVEKTGTAAKTATEVNTDKVSEVSTLAAAARNTTAAYKSAFTYCSMYSGDTDAIVFELSTDFEMSKMTSQEILSVLAVWQAGGLADVEYRNVMRKAGYATLGIEDAKKEGFGKVVETQVPVDNNAK